MNNQDRQILRSKARRSGLGLSLLTLAFGIGCDPPPPPGPTLFLAEWSAAADETELYLAADFDDLEAERQDFANAGQKLVDLEWGNGRFGGLFRAGTGLQAISTGPWSSLALTRQARHAAGLRLSDIEVWDDNGERRYAGLWDQGPPETLFEGLDVVDFHDKREELGNTHVLADFETVSDGMGIELIAVWHPGPPPGGLVEKYVFDTGWCSFHSQLHQLGQQGFRPVEIERVETGQGSRFSARWQPDVADDWLGVDFSESQLKTANSNLTAGFEKSGITNPLPEQVGAPSWLVDFGMYTSPEAPCPDGGVPQGGSQNETLPARAGGGRSAAAGGTPDDLQPPDTETNPGADTSTRAPAHDDGTAGPEGHL